jgi:hypothetical protein
LGAFHIGITQFRSWNIFSGRLVIPELANSLSNISLIAFLPVTGLFSTWWFIAFSTYKPEIASASAWSKASFHFSKISFDVVMNEIVFILSAT